MIHTVKGFSVVTETEIDVFYFLEFSCLFYDPMDVGNLFSGSSAFFFFLIQLVHLEILGSCSVEA